MKLHLLLLFLLFTALAQAQRPANAPPAANISRDRIIFSGAPGTNDLLIINRSSGTFITGTPGVGNAFDWSEATNLGVSSIDSAALAHFIDAGAWSLAVTNASFNRVQYVPLDGSEPPASVDPIAPEPVTLAAFDTGPGQTSTFVAGFKKAGPTAATLIAIHPGGFPPTIFFPDLWSSDEVGANPRQSRPLYLHPVYNGAMACITDAVGGSQLQFFQLTINAGTLRGSLTGLPANAEFTAGQFDQDLEDITVNSFRSTTSLAWSPTDNFLRAARLTDANNSGTLHVVSVGSYNMGRPIKSVRIIEETASRLVIAWADAAGGASLYDYDGRVAPVLVGPVDLDGMDLDDVIPLPGGDFILIGDRNGSLAYDRIHRSGNSYTRIATGSIPTAPAKPLYSNIIAFNGEPFVSPNAKPVARKRVPDWTTNAAYAAGNITLSSLLDGGTTAGLGNAQPAMLAVPGTTTHALPNQIDSATSITLLDAANVANQTAADVIFSHPSGSYQGPLTIQIKPAQSGIGPIVYYQLDGGEWNYVPSPPARIEITSNTTVRAYATHIVFSFGNIFTTTGQGPIRSATYTTATPGSPQVAANTDANSNGLSDAWEQLTGITDPGGDTDGDGFLNLQEHNFGTDPGSSSSNPGIVAQAPNLNVVNTLPTASSSAELRWDASDTAVVLESSNDMQIWTVVTTGIVRSGGDNVFSMPTKLAPRSFYRLRR
ncbi:MAG: hypothetical protein JNM99_11670 [Verrucomicrobiaceae bacterium]|nr:hypothetical protein [Verrucomicrobiaceae bacterium]